MNAITFPVTLRAADTFTSSHAVGKFGVEDSCFKVWAERKGAQLPPMIPEPRLNG
jgi:hypothetical protein